MALDKNGIPFHPSEYDPDFPRLKCPACGLMNSCTHTNPILEPWYPRLPILLEGGTLQNIPENNIFFHDWTMWSLNKIRDCKVEHFKVIIEDFIHPELLKLLLDEWPKHMDPDPHVTGRYFKQIEGMDAYEKLHKYVFDNWYIRCAIVDKFGLEVEYESTNFWLWKDVLGYTINDVHVDYKDFEMTFGLFLPGEEDIKEYGTQFWKPKVNVDEFWSDDVSLIREDCELLVQAPFTNGTCYFMPRTKYSWHSSPILDKEMNRHHVYGYYKTV